MGIIIIITNNNNGICFTKVEKSKGVLSCVGKLDNDDKSKIFP